MSARWVGVFTVALAGCAGIAWLAGYNFDQRGIGPAYFTVVALFIAAYAAHTFGDDT